MEDGVSELPALQRAGGQILAEQAQFISIPKRFSLPVREIWEMQPRFEIRQGVRPLKLITHPRFRASYDFYCLRGRSGEALEDGCEWWTRLQEVNEAEQRRMVEAQGKSARSKRRRRRRKPAST